MLLIAFPSNFGKIIRPDLVLLNSMFAWLVYFFVSAFDLIGGGGEVGVGVGVGDGI